MHRHHAMYEVQEWMEEHGEDAEYTVSPEEDRIIIRRKSKAGTP